MTPTLGRIVLYRSRTGGYTLPAIVTATGCSLSAVGVAAGAIPDLSDADHVHLTVLTAGIEGKRATADDLAPSAAEDEQGFPRSENRGGTYAEWDVAPWRHDQPEGIRGTIREATEDVLSEQPAGTWAWPARA